MAKRSSESLPETLFSYPCDFFVEESCRLGNLQTDSLETLNRRLSQTSFLRSSWALPQACQACGYLELCRGGCKRYRKEDGKYLYCNAVRLFFAQALPDLKELLTAHLSGL